MINERYSILVTGVGALIGQGVAESLRLGGRSWVLGVDRRITLRARDLCNQTAQKPDCAEDSDAYLAFYENIIRLHHIDLIIPGISHDMVFLDQNRAFFQDLGVRLALNDANLIALVENKADFAKDYAHLDLPQIPTLTQGSWQDAVEKLGPAPLLLKPSIGEGSVGVVHLQDEVDFAYWTQRTTDGYLIQRIIGARQDEYTVGSFGFGDGTSIGPLIFRRLLTRAGNTGEAEVVEHPAIAAACARIIQHYRPIGPTNLQFRVENGDAYLLEINPRLSSSCSLRTAFGFNEAEMCIDFYLNNQRPAQPALRSGFAQRYTADRISYAGPDL
jgi:carbamoyl-phosphate synthase large subunit